MPALFIFRLDPDATLTFENVVPLDGNVLDVIFIRKASLIIYSMDILYKPFSTTVMANDDDLVVRPAIGVLQYRFDKASYERLFMPGADLCSTMQRAIKNRPFVQEKSNAKGRSIGDLLYGLESLRKRASEEDYDHVKD